MTKKQAIQLFEEKKIRTIWDDEEEKWYFSIVDTVAVLTNSENPQTYWRVLKKRLRDEGNETVTEWKRHGLQEGVQFATLTDIIYSTWAGMTAKGRPRLASPLSPPLTPEMHCR